MSSLRLVEEAMPQLSGPGGVLVEVQALGLNLADVFCCLGEQLAMARMVRKC
jgi:NADPH:quinone reductase-like Zn-dependent oxidoreductase